MIIRWYFHFQHRHCCFRWLRSILLRLCWHRPQLGWFFLGSYCTILGRHCLSLGRHWCWWLCWSWGWGWVAFCWWWIWGWLFVAVWVGMGGLIVVGWVAVRIERGWWTAFVWWCWCRGLGCWKFDFWYWRPVGSWWSQLRERARRV